MVPFGPARAPSMAFLVSRASGYERSGTPCLFRNVRNALKCRRVRHRGVPLLVCVGEHERMPATRRQCDENVRCCLWSVNVTIPRLCFAISSPAGMVPWQEIVSVYPFFGVAYWACVLNAFFWHPVSMMILQSRHAIHIDLDSFTFRILLFVGVVSLSGEYVQTSEMSHHVLLSFSSSRSEATQLLGKANEVRLGYFKYPDSEPSNQNGCSSLLFFLLRPS